MHHVFLSNVRVPIPESVRNSPWLWIGLAAVVVGSLVYHNFFRKPKFVPTHGRSTTSGSLLSYTEEGRSGYVHYKSREARFSMYYEFGGGESLVGILVPDAESWEQATSLPLARREYVLQSIGRQVVLDKTGGRGSFQLEGNWLQIYP